MNNPLLSKIKSLEVIEVSPSTAGSDKSTNKRVIRSKHLRKNHAKLKAIKADNLQSFKVQRNLERAKKRRPKKQPNPVNQLIQLPNKSKEISPIKPRVYIGFNTKSIN